MSNNKKKRKKRKEKKMEKRKTETKIPLSSYNCPKRTPLLSYSEK